MTKFFAFITAVTICLPVITMAQNKTYVFEGTMGTLSAPATLYIRHYLNKTEQIDSSVLNKGHFYFKGIVKPGDVTYLALSLSGNKGWKSEMIMNREIYLAPGTARANSSDSLRSLHYLTSDINIAQEKLEHNILTLFKPYGETQRALFSPGTDGASRVKLNKQLKLDSARFQQGTRKLILSFISTHSASPLSLRYVEQNAAYNGNTSEAEPMFNLLAPQLRTSPQGKLFARKIMLEKRLAIGQVLPDFTLPDTAGKYVSVTDFKGKYLLIDFWASWCMPCRAENPNVLKAYNSYKQNGFTVLGVSLDMPGAKNAWLKAVRDDQLPWTQVSDLRGWKSTPAQLFAIDAIPQNYLIGPDGKILGKNLRGVALEKKLEEIFKTSDQLN